MTIEKGYYRQHGTLAFTWATKTVVFPLAMVKGGIFFFAEI